MFLERSAGIKLSAKCKDGIWGSDGEFEQERVNAEEVKVPLAPYTDVGRIMTN